MKPDIDIKRDVEEELRLNPDIDATDIAVAVKNGVVTLSGFTRSYSQDGKLNAPSSASTALPVWPTTSRCDCRCSISARTRRLPGTPSPPSSPNCHIRPSTSGSSFATAG